MAANLDWRRQAVICAMGHYARDIVDGTPEGNAYIGQVLFPLGGNGVDPEYKNYKTAWCGRFLEAVFRPLGFRFSLDSVGRVLAYANYNAGQFSMKGAPDDCEIDGDILSLMDYHSIATANIDQMREVYAAWDPDYTPRPGDIALHQKEGGSWHGHVMMVKSVYDNGDIVIIEGNHSKTVGPMGDVRDGIGTRIILKDDPYLDWIVVPSDLDFDPDLRIGTKESLS